MNATKNRVYSLLTDPSFLARSLPDAEDVRVIDENSLEAKLRLRLAVVSGKMKVKVTLTDRQPPARATLLADASGSGTTMKIVSTFTLAGDMPTTMSWTADADISGVMAGLGSTILKGFATKKVTEIFEGITKAVEASAS